MAWSSKFFYGKILGRVVNAPGVFNISYVDDVTHMFMPDGDVLASHFKHFELGAEVDVAEVEQRAAMINSVVLGGSASRELVPVGCTIVSVDSVPTPRVGDALTALVYATSLRGTPAPPTAATGSTPLRCTVVVLRRPAPQSPVRGWARPCCFRRKPFHWRDDIASAFDDLIKQAGFARRGQAVFEELKKRFGYALDESGKCVLPSLKDVENRMLSSWKRSEKQKSDLAQDSAARALARASRADEPGDHDDEIVDSDDDNDAADDHGDAIDDDAPMDSGMSPAAIDVHFANLDGVKVSELRTRLRAKQVSATVAAIDIPANTQPGNKSAAVLRVLRERLARALANEEE